MSEVFGYSGEAVRVKVKVKKYEGAGDQDFRRFSVDPQITSFEVLHSILAKAFDIKGNFAVSYRALDNYGVETFVPLLSDWDLDAAFLSASDPCLRLEIELIPYSGNDEWEGTEAGEEDLMSSIMGLEMQRLPQRQLQQLQGSANGGTHIIPVQTSGSKPQYRLHGLIMNQVERTFNMVQRAFNLGEDPHPVATPLLPPRPPLSDGKFFESQDLMGKVVQLHELKSVIYHGGIEPSLRKVVWKLILNVYPCGMSGTERIEYIKNKTKEYSVLRDNWRRFFDKGQMSSDLSYVTGMVMKDVLRTDRHHPFYAGSDDSQNIVSLFNILTTYALNHPAVSYCQGMSDLASPLLVTMIDEAQAYICFCALMRRLRPYFMLDGEAMTKRFQHLSDGLMYYDPEFYAYLKSHQADDLLFCYRWLLLEMKREFAFDDALHMMEVMWSSLPSCGVESQNDLPLFDVLFAPLSGGNTPPPVSPLLKTPRTNVYSKVCALRRQGSGASPVSHVRQTGHVAKYRHNQSLEEPGSGRMVAHKVKPYSSLDDATCLLARTSPGEPSQTSSSSPSPSPSSSVNTPSPTALCSSSSTNDLEHGDTKSSSTGNLLHARKSSNMKQLKERFSTSRTRNVCSSLEILDRQHGSIREETQDNAPRKPGKIIRNLNEFQKFSSLNRSRLSSTTENSKGSSTTQKLVENSEDNPTITLTKSCDDNDSDRSLNEKSTKDENGTSDSSPDDSEYLPMTNSMTRELRLELDKLDRKVFGSGYNQHSSVTSENDDTESVDSDVKPLPMDSPTHSFGYQQEEHSETCPLIRNEDNEPENVFIWENPLKTPGTPGTPDEQADLEYDDCGKKAVPNIIPGPSVPVQPSAKPTQVTSAPKTSHAMPSPSVAPASKKEEVSLAKRRGATEPHVLVTNNCEEAVELNGSKPSCVNSRLPPPHQFGGGNPFLMFLCLTVLQQHRDVIMHNGMDYNEMAMHFDKMVRKHDVHRVLNHARRMFASYLKQFNSGGQPAVGSHPSASSEGFDC